jgi:hypothetical protein
MITHNLGYPRIGNLREIIKVAEAAREMRTKHK